ncbi:MAG TPA: BolA family transcriptional regulator [Holosporales bacterium]|nr:BolA family transcriptional regulator [Holosporales bacterium]
MITLLEIEEALNILSPDVLKIEDHSYKHADHYEGSDTGITHVKISIKSESFSSLTKIQIHQKIYHALDVVLKKGLHAIQIEVL